MIVALVLSGDSTTLSFLPPPPELELLVELEFELLVVLDISDIDDSDGVVVDTFVVTIIADGSCK